MSKLLFLDIDGVLNNSADHRDPNKEVLGPGTVLCQDKVDRYLSLIDKYKPRVVLSSTWRKYPVLFGALMLKKIKWDYVTDLRYPGFKLRSTEIIEFIDKHNVDISNVIILDDDRSITYEERFKGRYVLTSMDEGLTEEKALELEELLKEQ